MSTIYDKKRDKERLDRGRNNGNHPAVSPANNTHGQPVQTSAQVSAEERPSAVSVRQQAREVNAYRDRAQIALRMVDDVVIKRYLSRLTELPVVTPPADVSTDDIVLFKINRMVYEKDEYAVDKFFSIVTAMTYTTSSIFLIVDGHGDHTDFYMGIKDQDPSREKGTVADTFKDAIRGQFPGAQLEDMYVDKGDTVSRQEKLTDRIRRAVSISSFTGVPSYKNEKAGYSNETFIQGIEKFALAMQGKEYTAIILAANTCPQDIDKLRNSYETIYTELSAMSSNQISYSTNESLANAVSRSKGYNDTEGKSDTVTDSHAVTHGQTSTTTHTDGESKDNVAGKIGKVGAPMMSAGAMLAATGPGAPAGAIIMGLGAAASLVGLCGKTKTKSDSVSTGDSHSESSTHGTSHAVSSSHTETFQETNGETSTIGTTKNFTLNFQNKHILEIQQRIDSQLERIRTCEGTGLWAASAYFTSYGVDRATAETAATLFKSIMQGESSGVESSAVNTWYEDTPQREQDFKGIVRYVSSCSHPLFAYSLAGRDGEFPVMSASMLSSREVAMLVGLPRKSVPGLPVVEHISLSREVVRQYDDHTTRRRAQITLGNISDQGVERSNLVDLNLDSLTQHLFITGSTGSGKSNTIYYLLDQLRSQPGSPTFLVIEPAKGEYRDVFGDVKVFGTNPQRSPLLRINPFRFPKGVHVLEHIDRLIDIFNVCWPLYAAMPALLKDAILRAYQRCGWNLYDSTNPYSDNFFPTFSDLVSQLVDVIRESAYSEEVKGNYQGSLVTRVKSLEQGLYRQIFTCNELGDKALFDENAIVDLSRVGSSETKSLIMGILVMRLNEYRASSDIPHNSPLRHVTVLEEAHNILRSNPSSNSTEGNDIAGKSVEMIANAIAEMRTYGEGFFIVDQSPGAVDISAIRNTNTKIVMRLPEYNDRVVAGKASGLKDDQTDEIAKLPTGVAVVYQNDWVEPVMCKIRMFDKRHARQYVYTPAKSGEPADAEKLFKGEVLAMLLSRRTNHHVQFDTDSIRRQLDQADLLAGIKTSLYDAIDEYKATGKLDLWKKANYQTLARLVTSIVRLETPVGETVARAYNYEEDLTRRLRKAIKDRVTLTDDKLVDHVIQAILHDYSHTGDKANREYSEWLKYMKNKEQQKTR